MELQSRYEPSKVESKWYAYWRSHDFFTPHFHSGNPVFSVVLPPPNVTGVLHVGHALNHTWQDILVRYHRMLGDNTLWLPGSDHAGISTQIKVEDLLRTKGQDRFSMGREQFVDQIWQWKEQYGGEILRQVARLGDSVDWSRLRFTLEPELSRAVTEAFVRLYDQGLIYRGDYLVNWCVSCRTALSDIEVEHQEETGQLTRIQYPLTDGTGQLTVATTRPETMLGDTAVAVHPDDIRYQAMIGKTLRVPLVNREIPIVADSAVDPGFGTGAVKVTPAHDPTDFGIGQRHALPSLSVIGEDGTMTANAGVYQGLDRLAARSRVLEDLALAKALVSEEPIFHAVGHCEKCGSVIEPLISRQWFVRMKPLAAPALAALDHGLTEFAPARFEKIYRHWLENLRDWCISRQIWWGHRIPAYHCAAGHVEVASTAPERCGTCGGELEPDPDVLDTWFSSALWPFSTMGWPDSSSDLEQYYPTSVLCTGWDIIPFWVSRMIMLGIHFTGQVPFRTVLINGLVRDAQGRKMSKSLGNGVNPEEMIDRYGADALRMALVLGSAPGNDIRFSEEKVEAAMHFANKVYNAVRFVLMNRGGAEIGTSDELHPSDTWIRVKLNAAIEAVSVAIDRYEFGEAARAIYDFFWDEFCDWYIELAKIRLRSEHPGERQSAQDTLLYVAKAALSLLHPFMPFVTEELWQALSDEDWGSIMVSPWPTKGEVPLGPGAWTVERFIGLMRTVRNLRAELNLPPQQTIQLEVLADNPEILAAWRQMAPELQTLGRVDRLNIELGGKRERPGRAIAGITEGGLVFIPLEGVVDLERERERLEKTATAIKAELARVNARLSDKKFVERAPQDIVQEAQSRMHELEARLGRVDERIDDLK